MLYLIKISTLTSLLIVGILSCKQPATTGSIKTIEDTSTTVKTLLASSTAAAQKANNDSSTLYDRYLDPRLKAYLDTAFKGWSLPAPNRWEKVYFDLYQSDSMLVNYVFGDFDCNGKNDFALVFKKATGSLGVYAFLSTGSSFKPEEIVNLGQDAGEEIETGLDLLPPGTYQYLEPGSEKEPSSLKIKCKSIRVMIFEKSAETFYWQDGKFKEITSGD